MARKLPKTFDEAVAVAFGPEGLEAFARRTAQGTYRPTLRRDALGDFTVHVGQAWRRLVVEYGGQDRNPYYC